MFEISIHIVFYLSKPSPTIDHFPKLLLKGATFYCCLFPFSFAPVQSFFGQRKVHRHWCIPTLSLMMREFFVATAKIAVFLADDSDPCTCCTCNFICILLHTYLYFLCKCLLTRLHCWRLTRLVLSANRSTLSHRLNGGGWATLRGCGRIF